MKYPAFFEEIEPIKLYDPLAETLGAFEDGEILFTYLDVVKSAGHSCPTVAGAYLMALYGLKALYREEIPQRGGIKVFFKNSAEDGVTGVIANIFTQITGATQAFGFKGLNGQFARNNLIFFSEPMEATLKLQRVDTQESVALVYDPTKLPADPKLEKLMGFVVQGRASGAEKKEFAALWQERVAAIFKNHKEVLSL